ncbi:transglutaminase family protein [Kocuria coralli]|uniref:Transglutaminase family protein n=1 Tax=Kocuria coralli TaxID=1461025 RepID=A0A5J5KUB4_9MICC|nr:transglutaminase family protein [Kocuria coralli]KAA9393134.1 transglutaminase family protein [Kocuria coralli]
MTRLKINHVTRYVYDTKVKRSHNEARMTPLGDDEQVVLKAELAVKPSSAHIHNYVDYFGTRVADFDVPTRHSILEVRSSSEVEVNRFTVDPDRPGVTWEDLKDPKIRDRYAEYLVTTPLTTPGKELQAVADEVRATAATPFDAVQAILKRIAGKVTYESGVTGVHTDADAVWADGRGVCQDLAHVAIALLRHAGIPARYVSGYLHPDDSAGIGVTVVGESHAWIEWWDTRWIGYDPTNHKYLDDLHVKVGHGRDYKDIPPLKGMVTGGGGTQELDVNVEVTRLE